MFDIVELLDVANGSDLIERLGTHLSGPVVLTGRGEPRSPECDIIDAAPLSTARASRLVTALDVLLTECELRLNVDELRAGIVTLVGRIGFLCSSLDLRVDPLRFFRIAAFLKLSSGIGVPVDLDDFFLVLRGTGRLYASKEAVVERRLFWAGLLTVPHKGVRTLAVQNLIRSDPFGALREVEELLDAGVNEALVAFEFLRRIGDPSELASLSVALVAPRSRDRLRSALAAAGEVEAVAAFDEAASERTEASPGPTEVMFDEGAWVISKPERGRIAAGFFLRSKAATARRFMKVSMGASVQGPDVDVVAAGGRLPMFAEVA